MIERVSEPYTTIRIRKLRYSYCHPDPVPPPLPPAFLIDRCNLWPWHAVIKILIRSIWRSVATAESSGCCRCSAKMKRMKKFRLLILLKHCLHTIIMTPYLLKENFAFQEVYPEEHSFRLINLPDILYGIFAYPYDGKVSALALCKKHFVAMEMIGMSAAWGILKNVRI